jgi:glycosyltransferase involved in cell wall biosynthesis
VGELHGDVNSLTLRDGAVFGIGWVFHETKTVRAVRLSVQLENGENKEIAASYGKFRGDVAASFPKFFAAKHSGFFLLGSCGQNQEEIRKMVFLVTLDDGVASELNVPQSRIFALGTRGVPVGRISPREMWVVFRRAFYFVKTLQFASLAGKVRRYLDKRNTPFLARSELFLASLRASELRRVVLVIDHDLGGGANHYRERLVAEKIEKGATVIILSGDITTLSYVLMVRGHLLDKRFAIPGYNFLLELAERVQFEEIIYNTGVTFVSPEKLPSLLVELKKKSQARLILLMHDFFMACPSHFLLDDTGSYCGVPDISRCRACLANNHQDYSSLFYSRDITEWRALWGGVIGIADEIRAFSDNSLSLLQKAYPALDASRVAVIPHTVTYLKHGAVKPSYTDTLKIGVVGQIGYHKGAEIISEISREIKARGLAIEIVVIGVIEASCEPSVVSETGFYRHDKLPKLIEESGVNIMLFPSVWPETFSYVVQELMALDLPVACFDFGAPAERLRVYSKGMILKETTASATLDGLILFHQRMYPRTRND